MFFVFKMYLNLGALKDLFKENIFICASQGCSFFAAVI